MPLPTPNGHVTWHATGRTQPVACSSHTHSSRRRRHWGGASPLASETAACRHNQCVATRVPLLLALSMLPPTAVAHQPPAPETGLHEAVTFSTYPHFGDNAALLRRLLSPLNALRVEQHLTGDPEALRAEPLDPASQRFAVYVPPAPAPAGGYALLVFVPPWDDARVPLAWIPVLNRTHTIFVTAAHSGNDANVLDRREPLALLGAYGTMQRYPVDPAHVYVGGFSGGSRVALRLALGYPDVFHGALLDAGSDPIGTAAVPLPPSDLLHQFQASSRIVFVTGSDDMIRQAQLARASDALQTWCVFDAASTTLLHTGHALASASGFAQAMDALRRPAAPDTARITACRNQHARTLAAELDRVRVLIDSGQNTPAAKLLRQIDARYGGLAAPSSVELARALDHANRRHR